MHLLLQHPMLIRYSFSSCIRGAVSKPFTGENKPTVRVLGFYVLS